MANWPPRLTPVWTPGKFRCGKLGPSIIYIYIGYILPTIQEYMSVDFIYWYWVYSDNNWGIFFIQGCLWHRHRLCVPFVYFGICALNIYIVFFDILKPTICRAKSGGQFFRGPICCTKIFQLMRSNLPGPNLPGPNLPGPKMCNKLYQNSVPVYGHF